MGHFFSICFSKITFLAKCHYPAGRLGGADEREGKVAAEGVGQKKVAAAEIVGKANPGNRGGFGKKGGKKKKRREKGKKKKEEEQKRRNRRGES